MQLLHTMLRVGDLQRSIDFYTKTIGMDLLRTTERPEQKYTLAFVAFKGGNRNGEAELELTYNHGVSEYTSAARTGTSPSGSTMSPRLASGSARRAATSPASPARSRAGTP